MVSSDGYEDTLAVLETEEDILLDKKEKKGAVGNMHILSFSRKVWMHRILQSALIVFDYAVDMALYLVYSSNQYAQRGSLTTRTARIQMLIHKLEKGALFAPSQLPYGLRHVKLLVKNLLALARDVPSLDIHEMFRLETLFEYKQKYYSILHKEEPYLLDQIGQIEQITSLEYGNEDPAYEVGISQYPLRHSVRHFSARQVTDEAIKRAVDMAKTAPSVCNRQPWKITVIDTPEIKKQILNIQNGNRGFGDKAPRLLLVSTSIAAMFTSRERNQAFIDGGIFGMNLMSALQSLQIGSCPLNCSFYSWEIFRLQKVLKMAASDKPVMLLAIGYPADGYSYTPSKRYPTHSFIQTV